MTITSEDPYAFDWVAFKSATFTPEELAQIAARTEKLMTQFTCPRCSRSSPNENDIREGYCGFCHDFTGDVRVYGMRETLVALLQQAVTVGDEDVDREGEDSLIVTVSGQELRVTVSRVRPDSVVTRKSTPVERAMVDIMSYLAKFEPDAARQRENIIRIAKQHGIEMRQN